METSPTRRSASSTRRACVTVHVHMHSACAHAQCTCTCTIPGVHVLHCTCTGMHVKRHMYTRRVHAHVTELCQFLCVAEAKWLTTNYLLLTTYYSLSARARPSGSLLSNYSPLTTHSLLLTTHNSSSARARPSGWLRLDWSSCCRTAWRARDQSTARHASSATCK